ncbi:MAG: hypothetical protein ACI4KH_03965 [Oscillospiraceae bacterium]
MDRSGGDMMELHFVTDEKIAETSSKGNQEKWYDADTDRWYKLDQFGYEALSECAVSAMLEYSNIETDTPFTFVRYDMENITVHRRRRTGCSSRNFLGEGQSIITLSHLLNRVLDAPIKEKLGSLTSDKKRIQYLAEKTAEYTGLNKFPEYLTLMFEIDSLFLNDDRHLNNIAVIEDNNGYSYCPIFDNGASLLSNIQMSQMDIMPKALISSLRARPFNTTFTRQMKSAQALFGQQLHIPQFTKAQIKGIIAPMLEYYPERDRDIIADRVVECIVLRQKLNV